MIPMSTRIHNNEENRPGPGFLQRLDIALRQSVRLCFDEGPRSADISRLSLPHFAVRRQRSARVIVSVV